MAVATTKVKEGNVVVKPTQYLLLVFFVAALLAVSSVHAYVDETVAAQNLRTYCTACHGLGKLRFITSESDQDLWNTILTQSSAKSNKLWGTQILKVLNWPSDSAPDFSHLMEPPDSDWMPRGAKRIKFASERVNQTSVRLIIIDTIKAKMGMP